jgi:hypothetical protein
VKFIACSNPPHKAYGVNKPVNLDFCVTYTPVTIMSDPRVARTGGTPKPEAPGIVFTAIGEQRGIKWSFEDDASRDAELARIDQVALDPTLIDMLKAAA